MIILGKYDELCPGAGYPRMKDNMERAPYANKEKILVYLKRGQVHMATAGKIEDVFTGEKTGMMLVYRNDGKYSWSSKMVYYVDKYNLRLPKEFEDHVLNKSM